MLLSAALCIYYYSFILLPTPFSIFLCSPRPTCQDGVSRSSIVISKGGLAATHKPQRHNIRYKNKHKHIQESGYLSATLKA